MSINVTTAPTTLPSRYMGYDQYSTGKDAPLLVQKTSWSECVRMPSLKALNILQLSTGIIVPSLWEWWIS